MPALLPRTRTTFVSPTTERLLEKLPPFEQQSTDIQAALDALSAELDRLVAKMIEVRNAFFPQTADDHLDLWEALLTLPIEPTGKSIEARKDTVMSFIRSWATVRTGVGWRETLTELIGDAWTYEEHDPDVLDSPSPGVIRLSIPFSTEILAPTVTATSSGSGTLTAGTYHYAVTAVNAYGETLVGVTDDATVGALGRVVVDWTDVDGAITYNVYRGASPSTLKKLTSVAVSTYTDTGAVAPSATDPPIVNSTESATAYEARVLARRITPAHIHLEFASGQAFIVGVSQIGHQTL